MQKVAKCCQ